MANNPATSSNPKLLISKPDVPNPFKHQIKLRPYDYIKISLMTITVFPVRCLLIVLVALVAWPLAYIGLAYRSEADKNTPVTGWRSNLRTFVFLLWRSIFFFGGFHWIRTIGERASSIAAPIVAVSPHSSFIDAVLPSIILGCSVVAKKETADAPIFGTLIKFTQPVFVSREDPHSRLNTIKEIVRRAHSGGLWHQIIIFPEGTCTNRQAMITFKPGGFYPGVPVQPVIIRYPNRTDSVTWTWDGPGVAKLFWLTLCQFNNYMEIEYLPVYTPNSEEKKDPHEFGRKVRAIMASKLGVPATEHTFDDCRLMVYAQQHQLPKITGLVEFNRLNREHGLKFETVKDLMKDFAKYSTEGQMSQDQFAESLLLPISDALISLFNEYNKSGTDTITFREYLLGLCEVSRPACTNETLKMAYELIDLKSDGSLKELVKVLKDNFAIKEENVRKVFHAADTDLDGKISFDEFKAFVMLKPEYMKLLMTYREMKGLSPKLKPATKDNTIFNGRRSSHLGVHETSSGSVSSSRRGSGGPHPNSLGVNNDTGVSRRSSQNDQHAASRSVHDTGIGRHGSQTAHANQLGVSNDTSRSSSRHGLAPTGKHSTNSMKSSSTHVVTKRDHAKSE